MRDPLLIELMFYEIGMKHGLRGRTLEAFVRDQYKKRRIPRVPEPSQPDRRRQLRLFP